MDLNTPTVDPVILTHDSVINSYELSNDGNWVITGARDKKVTIWDVNNLKEHRSAVTTNDVGIVTLNTNNDTLTTFETVGLRNAKKWSVYSFPELELRLRICHLIQLWGKYRLMVRRSLMPTKIELHRLSIMSNWMNRHTLLTSIMVGSRVYNSALIQVCL